MCATCGCSDEHGVKIFGPDEDADHHHAHDHPHDHDHAHPHDHQHEHAPDDRTILLEQAVLARNDDLAERNRRWLAERDVRALNVMSSPGSGKTTLLERTIAALHDLELSVIEGDQATLVDADRIRAAGATAVQVNTGAGCHLDAQMIDGALRKLDPPEHSVVLIENVGNLVCPALFDLGEHGRAVLTSVTEGADKPLKYPHMFRTADLVLLNKIDLLPYVDFDVAAFTDAVAMAGSHARVAQISATRGDGLDAWYDWLRAPVPAHQHS